MGPNCHGFSVFAADLPRASRFSAMPRRRPSGNGSHEPDASTARGAAGAASATAAKPPGGATAAVGMGGALNAAWARMFDMVNEAATRAARSPPSFGSGHHGSPSGQESDSPGSASPSSSSSSSPVSGGRGDPSGSRSSSHGIVRHGARKRPRDKARHSAAYSSNHHPGAGNAYIDGGTEDEEGAEEPGSGRSSSSSSSSRHGSSPRAGINEHGSSSGGSSSCSSGSSGGGGVGGPTFHGFPCPSCGGGVGFNARKCRNCGKVCRYVAGTNAATLTAGSSHSSSSGGGGGGSGNSREHDRNRKDASEGGSSSSSSVRSHKKRPRVEHHASAGTVSAAGLDGSGGVRTGAPMRVGTPAAAAAKAAKASRGSTSISAGAGASAYSSYSTAADGSGLPLPPLADPSDALTSSAAAAAAAAAVRLPRVAYSGPPLYDADGQLIPLMSSADGDHNSSEDNAGEQHNGADGTLPLSLSSHTSAGGGAAAASVAASLSSSSSPSSSSPTSGAKSGKGKKSLTTSPGGNTGAANSSNSNNSSKKGESAWAPPVLTEESSKGLALPAHLGPRPELLSPLLASQVGRKGLRAHVVVLRTESVQKVARPLLSKLMAHPLNRGMFNEPVDADSLALPDYRKIVVKPMDLGTVRWNTTRDGERERKHTDAPPC